MKKNLFRILMAFTLSVGMAFPVLAAPSTIEEASTALAEASNGTLHFAGTQLRSGWIDCDDAGGLICEAINGVFRGCGFSGPFWYRTAVDGTIQIILSDDIIQSCITDQGAIDAWLAENVENIIPDGMTKEEAMIAARDWICANTAYDESAPFTYEPSEPDQSARTVLTQGRGVCAGYSKAFRSILEYVPFNSEGVTDWESGTEHMQVAHVSRRGASGWSEYGPHAWAAIQDEDGTWLHYDLMFYDNNTPESWCWAMTTEEKCAFEETTPDALKWYY